MVRNKLISRTWRWVGGRGEDRLDVEGEDEAREEEEG
jgi:hypothetical protein